MAEEGRGAPLTSSGYGATVPGCAHVVIGHVTRTASCRRARPHLTGSQTCSSRTHATASAYLLLHLASSAWRVADCGSDGAARALKVVIKKKNIDNFLLYSEASGANH